MPSPKRKPKLRRDEGPPVEQRERWFPMRLSLRRRAAIASTEIDEYTPNQVREMRERYGLPPTSETSQTEE